MTVQSGNETMLSANPYRAKTDLSMQEINLASIATFMRDDVHGIFARLRESRPVSWHQHPDSGSRGFWAVTRYDDIVAVSRDTETFSSRDGIQVMFEGDTPHAGQDSMIEMDPPQHTRYRRLVAETFSRHGVTRLEAQIRGRVRAILDDLQGRDDIDIVQDFATPLPMGVFYDLMGVPAADQPRMLELADQTFFATDPRLGGDQKAVAEAGREIQAYGRWLAEQRRADPKDDLMSRLAHAEADGERLSLPELGAFFGLLGAAGADTTRASITYGLEALTLFPDQKRALLADLDGRIDGAVEEIVRWASPTMHMRRTATRDTEIGGQKIRAGDKVALWFISGNRDEECFNEPFQFDITRSPNPHMAFGMGGPHFCLGAHLAKLEIKVAFTELLTRYPGVHATGAAQRLHSNFINGPYALPARLGEDRDRLLRLRVARARNLSDDVRYFEFEHPEGEPLPEYSPGSHLDVHLPNGLIRQYSLCDIRDDRYAIAVKREPESRGGSQAMHDELQEGDPVTLGVPRNHFPLVAEAGHYVLLAGGIGITPLLSMARSLLADGKSFELHYFVRSPESIAFKALLSESGLAERTHLHAGLGRERVAAFTAELLSRHPQGHHLYLCGPQPFMDLIHEQASAVWPEDHVHLEYFAAGANRIPLSAAPFRVVLAKSGFEVEVPADKTIVQVLSEHGIQVDTSCEQGICGTCRVNVIEGEPEHHDQYLTDAEHAAGKQMCACVSRAKGDSLILDL